MKGITLFAAICFCLWFVSEVISVSEWLVRLFEDNPNFPSKMLPFYLQNSIATLLAALSGVVFFFVLFSKQLKKK